MISSPTCRNCTLLALLFLLLPSSVRGRDYIDITAEVRKIPTAVPYFLDSAAPSKPADETGRIFAEILGRSLQFHGFINVVDPQRYDGLQTMDWNALGVELLVKGSYQRQADEVVFELRLFDVLEGQVILGRRYRGPWSTRKQMLFKFCDTAIDKLSGTPGCSQSKIAFVSDTTGKKEIYITDVLGMDIQQVTHHQYLAVSPRFTPDGKKLAYSSYHRGKQNLYLTELGKRTTRAISWREGLNMTPDWSPDAKLLVLTLSMKGNSDLYLTEPFSAPRQQVKILRQLTRNNGINVSPSWSPDGSRIAFVSDRGGTPQIYIMEVANGKTRRLTFQGAYNTSPAWSPLGDTIAYAAQQGPTFHLFTIGVEGGKPEQITHTWGSHEAPSWSPDGKQLVFSRKRDDKLQLCAVFKNGIGLRVLFRMPGHQTMPCWSPRLPL